METVILTLVIVLLSVAGLALGVIFGREPIKGSCGGLACLKDVDCSICPHHRKASRGSAS
ncbi:(Na+)-NQR maturation NqrM [Pelagibacterium montanilacus]|uniref:(Na+)-NQR maturation NqrM n=1 Tax=Pelagibacterium montanilacus TaxID=2185280 RepID=UPI000F8DD25E|nr:(Na+)-NQR maturation NqrM [Pelagibacterium montanilacus]